MAQGEVRVQLSLLERLIDHEPENTHEVPLSRSQSLRQLRAAVRRDLEWLLNTVRPPDIVPPGMPELSKSLLAFGLPDFTTTTLNSAHDEQRLLRSIEASIRLFEPRLSRVRVSARQKLSKKLPSLHFQIEAMLMVDPAPELILFDTVLEVARGSYQVKGE